MTTHDSLKPEPQSRDYTIATDRLIRILAAGRNKSARFIRKKKKFEYSRIKRQVSLVETDSTKDELFHRRFARRRSSSTFLAISVSRIDFAISIASVFPCVCDKIIRTASRIKRLIRLRAVARLSTRVETINAKRENFS